MKKILLATSALVGFAGAAAAEVSLSGYAEMGIQGGSAVDTQFHNDIDVTFKLSGETDGGLSFGATIDIDELNGDNINPTAGGNGCAGTSHCPDGENDSSVWVEGSFGKVTMGDTDGAFDWALSEIYMGTTINDDHSTHAGAYWFTGLDGAYDGQVMRYEYSFGDFAGALSAEMDDTTGALSGDAVLGLGVKWSGDFSGTAVNAGFGYQSNGTVDVWGLSAGATMANGIDARIGYADLDNSNSWAGIGIGYTTGALMVQANYGEYDFAGINSNGWGLVANYDLGGGAVLMAGYGSSGGNPLATSFNGNGDETFSLGVGLSF